MLALCSLCSLWLGKLYRKEHKEHKGIALPVLGFLCVFMGSSAFAVEPPLVKLRDISMPPRNARGNSVMYDTSTTLFLPDGWKDEITSAGEIPITVHFHSAMWYAIEEHTRRGAHWPMLAIFIGEGSNVYRRPFENTDFFERLMTWCRQEMIRRGGPESLEIGPIEMQSFSAGYGSVREILKLPVYQKKITRVVLADSLYANLTTSSETIKTGEETTTIITRHADPVQMKSFADYAKRAANGDCEFLLAHTTIFTGSYASSVEAADSLIESVGGKRDEVTSGSIPAATGDFRLYSRCDIGNFHIWGYDGNNPKAHIAVARTIADFWNALDAAKRK